MDIRTARRLNAAKSSQNLTLMEKKKMHSMCKNKVTKCRILVLCYVISEIYFSKFTVFQEFASSCVRIKRKTQNKN